MKFLLRLFVLLFLFASPIEVVVNASVKPDFNTAPCYHNGKKWRVAYYEGGEYINYQKVLTATVRGLIKLGWIKSIDIPLQQDEQTKELWNWLVKNIASDYLEFVYNGYYSANWDDDTRKEMAEKILSRVKTQNDIDLIIAMGTWAGRDLANSKHNTPTIVLSTSDPISAGIIKSVNNSGFTHVHAHVDPSRWERQIRLFHEIIGFNKLGIAYEDTVNGRSYAAIDDVEKVANERGFEIVRCYTKSDISDTEIAADSVKACFEQLTKKSDAIYVTEQGGVTKNSVPELVAIANKHRTPTFTQHDSDMVKYGFLVSTSRAEYKYTGEFHALTIAKVFNGAKPNQLTQLFEEPTKISINLKTAEIIGFKPPLILLGAADEIFQTIEIPK